MTRRPVMATAMLIALMGGSGCTALSKMGQVMLDPSIPVGTPNDQPTEVAFSLNASPTLNGNPYSLDPSIGAGALEPLPYAVSLTAGDPYALTEKVETLLDYLQEEFPPVSPVEVDDTYEQSLPRSPMEESTPGSYGDPTVILNLPTSTPKAAEQIATPMAIKILQLRDDSLLRNSVYQLLDQDPAKTLRSTYIRDDDYLLLPGQFKFVRFEPLHADTRFIAVIANYSNQENAIWQQALRIEPRGRQIVLSVVVDDSQIVLKEES